MSDTITKAEYTILERMFAGEIQSALRKDSLPYCYQSKAKILEKMEAKGLIEKAEFTLNGRFQMKIEGWILTHSGRFTYCANC